MGEPAAVVWAGPFALAGHAFFYRCASLAASLPVYHLIPIMPFGAFGGARVWAWNKLVFGALAPGTLALLAVALAG